MKRRSMDVTAATNPQHMPPTHYINAPSAVREQRPTPARRPERIQPPVAVSGFGETGIRSHQSPSPISKLPETVSARQIQRESFRYGGGRSAANISLPANINRKVNQP
jgi:hypothetical protein